MIHLYDQDTLSARPEYTWPAFRPLDLRWRKWRLCGDEMKINGLTVPEGFDTDFASAPGHRYVRRTWPAAVGHDWLYRTHPLGWDRARADRWYRETLRDFGISAPRAWWNWAAVRALGWRAWEVTR